jgi:hypothetical protein
MRTALPLALVIGVPLCAHTGCKRSFDAKHVAELDSMITVVNDMDSALHGIDTRRLHELDSAYALQRDSVLAYLKDTIDLAQATALGNYHRSMTATLDRVIHEFDRVSEELGRTRTQLEQLKHDVEHGLLAPEQGSAFLSQEKAFTERNVNNARTLIASANTVLRTWEAYHGRVDSVVQPMKDPLR